MAVKDKVYKCLSPVGNRNAVDTFPLAPRLKTIEGKTIYLSVCGEPDITLALEKRLKSAYPKVYWQLPYAAKMEKAGIPTIVIDLEDQRNMVTQEALAAGVPNIRFLHASR